MTLSDAPFPAFVPTARGYNPGNWPVREYKAQDGFEYRILYGSKETGAGMALVYNHLQDAEAQEFLDHYREVRGTFQTFRLNATGNTNAKGGWEGDAEAIGKTPDTYWRYAEAPKVQQIGPGISSVTVTLVAVL